MNSRGNWISTLIYSLTWVQDMGDTTPNRWRFQLGLLRACSSGPGAIRRTSTLKRRAAHNHPTMREGSLPGWRPGVQRAKWQTPVRGKPSPKETGSRREHRAPTPPRCDRLCPPVPSATLKSRSGSSRNITRSRLVWANHALSGSPTRCFQCRQAGPEGR